MINKKLLAAASLAAVVSTSSAFAKTEGNYVGVDLLATNFKISNDDQSRKSQIHYGVGVNYKHAFNLNNFFVAPGAYFNYNSARVKERGSNDSRDLAYSYGAKADLGYDITDKFAGFVTVGYQLNRDITTTDGNASGKTLNSYLYGVGVKYSATSNVDVALAYEYIDYNRSGTPDSYNPEVIKVGFAYKF